MTYISEGEFVCENCAQTFPLHLTTIVRSQVEGPEGKGPELTFHDPACAKEYASRGAPKSTDES